MRLASTLTHVSICHSQSFECSYQQFNLSVYLENRSYLFLPNKDFHSTSSHFPHIYQTTNRECQATVSFEEAHQDSVDADQISVFLHMRNPHPDVCNSITHEVYRLVSLTSLYTLHYSYPGYTESFPTGTSLSICSSHQNHTLFTLLTTSYNPSQHTQSSATQLTGCHLLSQENTLPAVPRLRAQPDDHMPRANCSTRISTLSRFGFEVGSYSR
jgi:hypothetical protein